MSANEEIAAERRRQIEVEGMTFAHDDKHTNGELLIAANCYLTNDPAEWPWDRKWWKPKNTRRNAVRAGALALAERGRLERSGADNAAINEAHAVYEQAVSAVELATA